MTTSYPSARVDAARVARWGERVPLTHAERGALFYKRHKDDPQYRERIRLTNAEQMRRRRSNPDLLAAERVAKRECRARQKAADPIGFACHLAFKNANRRYGRGVTFEEYAAVWRGPCFECGITPAHGVDHIVGKTRGGTNELANLQSACLTHNKSKAGAMRPVR